MASTLDEYYRDTERVAIRGCLENYELFETLPSRWQTELVMMLERGCNNATFDKALERNIPKIWDEPKYVEQYSNIGYHLKINLDPTSSVNIEKPEIEGTFLANMIYNHMLFMISTDGCDDKQVAAMRLVFDMYIPSFDPLEVAFMSGRELNPYLSQDNWLEIQEREKQKIDQKFTKMYPCGQCGTRRATFKKIQTCALDEDNTLFIECDECGHCWRIY